MKGTEKQIVWATKIQNQMLCAADDLKAIYKDEIEPDHLNDLEKAFNVIREKILGIEAASEYIAIGKTSDGIDDYLYEALAETGIIEY